MADFDSTDLQRLGDALAFAIEHHGDQTRKGKSVPYVSHLLQVAGLVLEHGGTVDQAVAGILHDTIEDCGVAADVLRERFGAQVARMVVDCSDLLEGDTPEDKSPWKVRKTRYVEHLRACGAATRLVAACDKAHNMGDLVADLRVLGSATLERFNTTPRELLWYHESVVEALGRDLPPALRGELDARLAELRRWITG